MTKHSLAVKIVSADRNMLFNNKFVFIFNAQSKLRQDLHEKAKLIVNFILEFLNRMAYNYTVDKEDYRSAEELLGALAKAVPPADMAGDGFWEYDVTLYE